MGVDISPKTYKTGSDSVSFQPYNFSSDTKEATAGEWTALYRITPEDGQGVVLGRGRSAAPQFAEGFGGLRLVSDSAAGQAEGDFRVTVRTKQQRRVQGGTLLEGDLTEYDLYDGAAGSGTKLKRSERRPLPRLSSTFETSEYEIWLEVRVDSTITVDDAEGETGIEFEGFLAERT
jgi:hypothetical protein